MANASHEKAGTYLDVQTKLSVENVLNLSEAVAAQLFQRKSGKVPINKVDRDGRSVSFAIKNLRGGVITRFRATAIPGEDGNTHARVIITAFTTFQRKMLGIPTESKQLGGWLGYSTFIETLKSVIEDADPSARSSIVIAAG
ncbi:MAG TPA: hypothetical protein VHU90_09925 [Galbitalea sp.]|nr:hypothetical protein [Galbitalea sp.]